MNNLADVLIKLNRKEEAAIFYRNAYNFFKAKYSPNHPIIVKSINNIAEVLQSLNRLKEAEEFFREALNIRKIYLLPNNPDIG
jgi:hypothetical protein